MKNITSIIEALIFASDMPLSSQKIKTIIEEVGEKEIRHSIEEINSRYTESGSALQIVEVAGGYQIVTHPRYESWLKKLYRSRQASRLTQKALETLAIIAYKQPITKQEVEEIRGVSVDSVFHTLIERNLITVSGRKKAPGNPLIYNTTKFFLEYFGLKHLKDLPKLKEIDELLKSDDHFLENLDQVALEQMLPEELGLSSMLPEQGNDSDAGPSSTDSPKTDAASRKSPSEESDSL